MFDSYEHIFDQRGRWYHEAMGRCPRARWREFRAVVDAAAPRPGETIVDLPAGGGYLAAWLPRGMHYIGVESSRTFHDSALPGAGRRILAPLHDTGLPTGSVDLVISLAGVHHLADRPALYREVARILKPEGRFVLADVRDGSDPARFLDLFVHAHNSMGHRGMYLDPADRAAMRASGLEIVTDRATPYTWDFDDRDELAAFVGLLFGLDRATPAQILRGVDTFLGADPKGAGLGMRWALDVIVACPAPTSAAGMVEEPAGQ